MSAFSPDFVPSVSCRCFVPTLADFLRVLPWTKGEERMKLGRGRGSFYRTRRTFSSDEILSFPLYTGFLEGGSTFKKCEVTFPVKDHGEPRFK